MMKKEINNINFKGLIGYLRKHYGEEGVQVLTRGLVGNEKYLIADKYDPSKITPVQEYHLVDDAYWVSNEFSLQLLANVKKVVPDPNPLFTAGENSVLEVLSKNLLFAARILGPAFLLKKASKINTHFNRTKDVSLVETTDRSAIFELRYKPECRVTRDVCNWNLGIYSGIAKINGAQGVKIEEVSCVTNGAECCVYKLTWKKVNLLKRLLRWFAKPLTRELLELIEDYEVTVKERDKLIDNLKESESRYRALIENSLTGIFILKNDIFVFVNSRFAQMLNFSPGEMLGRSFREFLQPDNKNPVGDHILAGGREASSNHEFYTFLKDGELIWLEVFSTGIEYNGQHLTIGNVIDFSSRRRAEELFKTLSDSSPNGIYIVQDGKFQFVNPKFQEYTGYTKDELLGMGSLSLVLPEDRGKVRRNAAMLLKGERHSPYEYRIFNKGGEVRWILESVTSIQYRGKRAVLGNFMNITRLKQAENSLRVSEDKYRIIFENTGTATIIVEEDTIISLANMEFTKMVGFSKGELEGKKSFVEFIVEEDLERVIENHRLRRINPDAAPRNYEGRGVDREGKVKDLLLTVGMIPGTNKSVASILDITEHRQFEKEMARLDRLNLVGEMAAGIGHEIRNPMTTVRGFLQFLGGKEGCVPYRHFYDLMIEELDRANSIITEFLSLAKDRPVNKKAKNLNTILEVLFPLIQADAMETEKNVKLELREIPELLLDEKEVRQLILNLVRNGLQAMPQKGVLTIRTFNEGDEVVLAVRDQGTGIAPESIDKLGTPFFTTKEQGTGLGLAVSYSIADRHNAAIKVKTGPAGTTFFVRFKT